MENKKKIGVKESLFQAKALHGSVKFPLFSLLSPLPFLPSLTPSSHAHVILIMMVYIYPSLYLSLIICEVCINMCWCCVVVMEG